MKGVDATDTLVRIAYNLCLEYHQEPDLRGNPYYQHPVAVMRSLPRDATNNQKILALLHDIVEDTKITSEYLAKVFPQNIINSLVLLTKRPEDISTPEELALKTKIKAVYAKDAPPVDEKIVSEWKKEFLSLSNARYGKYVDRIIEHAQISPQEAIDAALVKLCDIHHNSSKSRLADMSEWNKTKRREKYGPAIDKLGKFLGEMREQGYEVPTKGWVVITSTKAMQVNHTIKSPAMAA